MEQVAQLKSLSDTIEKLKVSHVLPFLHWTLLAHALVVPGTSGVSLHLLHALRHTGERGGGKGGFSTKRLRRILFRLLNHQC